MGGSMGGSGVGYAHPGIMGVDLRPFQRRFVSAACRRGVRRAALSLPRGNGKSWLAGYLVSEALRPGGRLYTAGAENVLLSGSFNQARHVYRFARAMLGEGGEYAYRDYSGAMGIRHKPSNTILNVLSSRAKSAFGIVGARLAVADEPGAWDVVGGELMADALDTAIGKPGTDLTVVYIGTLAPAVSGWWHDLIADGSGGSTFVQALTGDGDKWDRWPEIRRCNPLTAISPEFRETLREERDKARPVARRIGRPVVGIDLGGGRAWSAAVAIWPAGRIEALALAPGTPSLTDQERRDRVPRGTYERLAAAGVLSTDGDWRVPRVETLTARALAWRPAVVVCDRFRLGELQDAIGTRAAVVPRIARWSSCAEDIRALRRLALDGPLSVEPGAAALLRASLSVAVVKSDDQGNTRIAKSGSHNTGRDDAAAALVLAAGAAVRRPVCRAPRLTLVA